MSNHENMPVAEIAATLAEHLEPLCQELLPRGHREGQEWVDARRAKGGLGDSMKVHLTGHRRGVWAHFAAGQAGDALDLVAYVRGLNKHQAIEWAKSWLGMGKAPGVPSEPACGAPPSVSPPDERHGPDDNDLYVQAARDLWRQAQPIAGTIGQLYLRKRGINIEIPPSLRYMAGLEHKPTRLQLPAVIAGVQDPDGSVVGVHRLFLRTDGRCKAPVTNPKMMLGRIAGGAVRLAPATTRLGISEGIENGLAAMELYPGLPVWAALSVSNMATVVLPETVREVVLLLDGDVTGSPADKAASKAALMLMKRRLKVEIIRPPEGKDLNDLLRERLSSTPAREARNVAA